MKLDFLSENSFLLLDALTNKKHYLRELSEKAKIAPSSVHKIISKLVKRKMVFAEKNKNRKVFRLNYDSPLTTKAVSLLFINKIINCKAFSKLKKLNPKGIYLFGTAAKGKITADSDIDLAVFFEKKAYSFKLNEIKRELSNELKRQVQLIELNKNKVKEMRKEKIELINEIKNKSTVLAGENFE